MKVPLRLFGCNCLAIPIRFLYVFGSQVLILPVYFFLLFFHSFATLTSHFWSRARRHLSLGYIPAFAPSYKRGDAARLSAYSFFYYYLLSAAFRRPALVFAISADNAGLPSFL